MRINFLLALFITALMPSGALSDVATAKDRAKSGTFDDAGDIRCAQEVGQSFGTCSAEVARADTATVVVVRFPNGFARTLTFNDREFLRGNATMSGVGTDTEWHLADGVFSIRVDDQRFIIPEALAFVN